MATHRASMAVVACSYALLQLLLAGVCTAANPVVPVSAQSFAVDVTDEAIAVRGVRSTHGCLGQVLMGAVGHTPRDMPGL